jgi:hypothetical protein
MFVIPDLFLCFSAKLGEHESAKVRNRRLMVQKKDTSGAGGGYAPTPGRGGF